MSEKPIRHLVAPLTALEIACYNASCQYANNLAKHDPGTEFTISLETSPTVKEITIRPIRGGLGLCGGSLEFYNDHIEFSDYHDPYDHYKKFIIKKVPEVRRLIR